MVKYRIETTPPSAGFSHFKICRYLLTFWAVCAIISAMMYTLKHSEYNTRSSIVDHFDDVKVITMHPTAWMVNLWQSVQTKVDELHAEGVTLADIWDDYTHYELWSDDSKIFELTIRDKELWRWD